MEVWKNKEGNRPTCLQEAELQWGEKEREETILLPDSMLQISWRRDHSPRSALAEVPDLFAQTTCLHQPLRDGETYDVWIRATDVMNNTKVSTSSSTFVFSAI